MTYNDTLRKAREALVLTIEQAAAQVCMPAELLDRMERGEVEQPEPHDLYYLAKLYAIDYIALMRECGYIKSK